MGFQGEYVRRGENTSPVLYDNDPAVWDGYNYINVDLEEIDGGAFWTGGASTTMGVIFIEAQFLAVNTSGDNTAAGCLIRRATYKFDNSVPAIYIARIEHDRLTASVGGPTGDPVLPADLTEQTGPWPEQISVRNTDDDGYQDVALNSMSSTVPDIAWPLRDCTFTTQLGPGGNTSVIRLQWSIYDKAGGPTYKVAWEVKLKMYRP